MSWEGKNSSQSKNEPYAHRVEGGFLSITCCVGL